MKENILSNCQLVKVFALLFLVSCSANNGEERYFQAKLSNVIEGKDAVAVKLTDLTNFQWEKVCFNRNEEVDITFYRGEDVINISLGFDKYFIDEGYVKGSPATRCYSNDKTMIVRKVNFSNHSVIQIVDPLTEQTSGDKK